MFPGYPDLIGRRAAFVGYGPGPVSYTAAVGDVITIPGKYIDSIGEVSLDSTGTYYGVAKPSFAGPRATWTIYYYTASTGAPLTGPTNLSAINFVISGFYGEY
jgi:hypothetical protein